MENRHLIDISVKYGLNSGDLGKLLSLMHQVGVDDPESIEFKQISAYICKMGLLEKPAEELIEELKLNKLIPE